ncbi:MAG: hypothetical protein HY556_06875 [Euryarchaeota archaeon]|nr:hypothetical protein [Euryarchaeota archaeon]
MTMNSGKVPVLVAFHCPRCIAPNSVELIALSRSGFMNCDGCGRRLKSADVMRALITSRRVETRRVETAKAAMMPLRPA